MADWELNWDAVKPRFDEGRGVTDLEVQFVAGKEPVGGEETDRLAQALEIWESESRGQRWGRARYWFAAIQVDDMEPDALDHLKTYLSEVIQAV